MKKQQGFIGIIIAIIIALVVAGGGYVAVKSMSHSNISADNNAQSSTVTSGGTSIQSDGTSASVDAGGVHISTGPNGGSVTTGSNGSSVKTQTTVTTSASASANGSTGSTGASSASSVTVSSINPASASIGQTVVIKGSGFSASGNTVNAVYGFQGEIFGVASVNGGTEIDLTIPQYVKTGPASVQVMPGTYVVSVTNASGATSNHVTFTITR